MPERCLAQRYAGAGVALAAKQDIVTLQGVSLRQEVRETFGALAYLQEPVARAAQEMMMMVLRSPFPARRLPGQIDRHYPPFIAECSQIPIDGGDPQTGDPLAGEIQNLGNG